MKHYSVLEKESISSLNIKKTGIYVDATLGLGGHTAKIAEKAVDGKVIAFDQDINALEEAKKRLSKFTNIMFVNDNFRNLEKNLKKLNINKIDGILYDLGTSYYQLTDVKRGFTYHGDSKLDMRMNQNQSLSAIEVLNKYSEKDLANILRKYGDEKRNLQLAREIVLRRQSNRIETNIEFNEIIKDIKGFSKDKHPSKNVYQAIRIEVNDEINAIEDSLLQASKLINIGATVSVITFHSLEDKITKDVFYNLKNIEKISEMGNEKFFKTHKTIYPSKQEVEENKASRSSKLRTITKVNDYE